MSLTREEVIDYLERLPAEELGALADEVLARLGMKLPPVVPAPPPPFHTAGVPIADGLTGIPTADVVLRAPGPDRVAVVRIVRRVLGQEIGLAEVRRLVDSAPVTLCEDLRLIDARELVEELRRAGADANYV